MNIVAARILCHETEGSFFSFKGMIEQKLFHIYEKATNEPVKVCLTIEELEQMLANKEVDFSHWEVQPCYTDYSVEDASY